MIESFCISKNQNSAEKLSWGSRNIETNNTGWAMNEYDTPKTNSFEALHCLEDDSSESSYSDEYSATSE